MNPVTTSRAESQKRSAHATLRGYLYQVCLGVERWLDLQEGEILVCEGDEDLDRRLLGQGGGVFEQVKDYRGKLGLGDAAVVESLRHFVRGYVALRRSGLPGWWAKEIWLLKSDWAPRGLELWVVFNFDTWDYDLGHLLERKRTRRPREISVSDVSFCTSAPMHGTGPGETVFEMDVRSGRWEKTFSASKRTLRSLRDLLTKAPPV